MKAKLLLPLCLTFCALAWSGCVVALGNRVPEEKRDAMGAPTLGRQLTDLKLARDSGALTEDEYHAAKKRLLDGSEPKPAHH